jgi:hypothetical protein
MFSVCSAQNIWIIAPILSDVFVPSRKNQPPRGSIIFVVLTSNPVSTLKCA